MNPPGTPPARDVESLPGHVNSATATVCLVQEESGRWQLYKNGAPFTIRGAGGVDHLESLAAAGGNTLRTWGVEQLESPGTEGTLLDRCEALNISVVLGLWVTHPRHGADYGDPTFLQQQRDRIRHAVERYRDHPAVLMWGLGNEMEEDGNDPQVWRELEVLAQLIKSADPAHPVCTVLAGTGNQKVAALMEHCPSFDLLGINIYDGADKVDTALASQGWDRPYLLTEFGPVGHWEVDTTTWGAPIEPSTATKAATYAAAHDAQFSQGRGLCLGTFCFIWGHKQETTATWFGMFLKTGEKTAMVDAMSRIWSGEEPANRAPVMHDLEAYFREKRVPVGSEHDVWVKVSNADADTLTFDWQVVAETRDRRSGGDAEQAPPLIPDCVVDNLGNRARIRVPDTPGAYRVFLYVRDGHGGGAAGNFPFYAE